MNRIKVALITGASSGIGKETAFALLKGGYTVYAAARRVDQMDDLKSQGAIPIKMDVTVEEDLLVSAFRGNIRFFKNVGTRRQPKFEEKTSLQAGGDPIRIHNW